MCDSSVNGAAIRTVAATKAKAFGYNFQWSPPKSTGLVPLKDLAASVAQRQ